MVTIATFDEVAKAKHLKKRFDEAGVRADVHNEQAQILAAGSDRHANAKVLVEEQDFGKANQLLTEWEGTDAQIAGAATRRSPRQASAGAGRHLSPT